MRLFLSSLVAVLLPGLVWAQDAIDPKTVPSRQDLDLRTELSTGVSMLNYAGDPDLGGGFGFIWHVRYVYDPRYVITFSRRAGDEFLGGNRDLDTNTTLAALTVDYQWNDPASRMSLFATGGAALGDAVMGSKTDDNAQPGLVVGVGADYRPFSLLELRSSVRFTTIERFGPELRLHMLPTLPKVFSSQLFADFGILSSQSERGVTFNVGLRL